MNRIDHILEHVKGPDVLDIGCVGKSDWPSDGTLPTSPDWLHGRLNAAYPTVYGIDVDADRIATMRTHGLNVHVADAQRFDLGRRFDTIAAGEIIEHIESPGPFLRCARDHLKPGGKIIVTTPYPFSAAYFLYAAVRFLEPSWNGEHVLWLDATTGRQLAERVGLRVAHMELVDYWVPGLSLRFRMLQRACMVLPPRMRRNTLFMVLVGVEAHRWTKARAQVLSQQGPQYPGEQRQMGPG